ncbi:flagellar hook-length control protein FliK [Vibrio mimicus]
MIPPTSSLNVASTSPSAKEGKITGAKGETSASAPDNTISKMAEPLEYNSKFRLLKVKANAQTEESKPSDAASNTSGNELTMLTQTNIENGFPPVISLNNLQVLASSEPSAQGQPLAQNLMTLILKRDTLNFVLDKASSHSSLSVRAAPHQTTQPLQPLANNAKLNLPMFETQMLLQSTKNGQTQQPVSALQSALNQPVPASSLHPLSQIQGHSPNTEWAAVRVDASTGKWGEQMMQVLHDRVTLQAQQNIQEAKIRLDPPELGKLDLLVRVEGDRLHVQINANAAATREALMQVSERLRTELQEQNFVHVDVNIGSEKGKEKPSQELSQEEQNVFAARDLSSLQPQLNNRYSDHWLNTKA